MTQQTHKCDITTPNCDCQICCYDCDVMNCNFRCTLEDEVNCKHRKEVSQ